MLKKALRTAQNYFPAFGEAKNEAYHWARRRFGLLHDRDFAALARLPARADDLFLDVGANRGQSILSMRRMRPNAQIVSFEPNPTMLRWLWPRFVREPGVMLVPFGLGARAETRTLYTPRYRGFSYDGLATFSEACARKFLSAETLYGFDADQLTVDEAVCETRTLDSLGLRPTLIKIDVEGCEHEVLQGGLKTLRACEPVLLVERYYDNPAVGRLLARLGYIEVRVGEGGFEAGSTKSENMFCMTPTVLATCQSERSQPHPSRLSLVR